VGYSDKAYPVDAARSSTWAYYGAIFIVMVGSSMLLLYYMLPKDAIKKALEGDLGVYERYGEEPSRAHNPEDQNWNRGYATAQPAAVQMPVRPAQAPPAVVAGPGPNILSSRPLESTLV
jgi:hypothetical protein